MIEHLGHVISDATLAEMRAWIADCPWPDLEPEDVDDLTDQQIVRGVARHYHGGVKQFLADDLASR